MTTTTTATDSATLSEVLHLHGFDSHEVSTFVHYCYLESETPAMCLHGCNVEPDGHCEHGNPSVFLFLGMI